MCMEMTKSYIIYFKQYNTVRCGLLKPISTFIIEKTYVIHVGPSKVGHFCHSYWYYYFFFFFEENMLVILIDIILNNNFFIYSIFKKLI